MNFFIGIFPRVAFFPASPHHICNGPSLMYFGPYAVTLAQAFGTAFFFLALFPTISPPKLY